MGSRLELSNAIRALAMDAVQQANSGHPGMPMGMAEIAEVLWRNNLKHNPADPLWADRDQLVLGLSGVLLSVLAALDGIGGARTTLGAHPEGTTHVAFVIAQEFLAFEEAQQTGVPAGTGDPFSPTFVMAALQHVALAHEGRVSTSRVNNGSRVCLTVPIDARRPN